MTQDKDVFNEDEFKAYLWEVFQYLEYLGYPDLVQEFDMREVGQAVFKSLMLGYCHKVSIRSCALGIFGATWTYQIVPLAQELPVQ